MKIDRTIPIQQHEVNPDQKVRDASKMYEQYFLNEMMKSMRKTVDHSKMNAPSMAENIYSEQLDNQYVEKWSDQGGVGLADIIYNQLQERFIHNSASGGAAGGGSLDRPQGPIPIHKGSTIKIDETKQQGLPIVAPKSSLPTNEVSFLYEWDEGHKPQNRNVQSPYSGDVLQSFRTTDERQILKLAHENGLQSTISFIGETKDIHLGDKIAAGQKLGTLSPYALGLTWQLSQVGSG